MSRLRKLGIYANCVRVLVLLCRQCNTTCTSGIWDRVLEKKVSSAVATAALFSETLSEIQDFKIFFLPRRVDRRKCCQVSLTKVGAKVNDDNVTKKLCYRRRTARQRLPKGSTLILEVSKFLRSLGEAKGSSRAKKQLYSSSCFNTTPACDGQMDGRTEGQTHDDSTYDAIRDACARKPT